MNKKGKHFFINGRVQGVSYRAFAQRKAKELDLTGWAKNLSDGRVEIMVFGDEKQLHFFQEFLQQGPWLAKVTGVEVADISWQECAGFEIF